MFVPNNVKKYREMAEWTLPELADWCDVPLDYLSDIEDGLVNPGLGFANLLAYAFDCKINDIFQVDQDIIFDDEARKIRINIHIHEEYDDEV